MDKRQSLARSTFPKTGLYQSCARRVEQVAKLIGHISSTSVEQSRDVDSFKQGIREMDALLQRDVVHVGVASASSDLNEEAQSLCQAMSAFWCRSGEDCSGRCCSRLLRPRN